MAHAIGQVLAFAVGVSLSPVLMIAVVLMLGTLAGRRNGPGFFLAGWVLGLAVVSTIVLLVAGGAGANDGQPATWVDVLKLVLGALLLLLAARQWRTRPRAGEAAELPKWMVDHRRVHRRPIARHGRRAVRHQPEEPGR